MKTVYLVDGTTRVILTNGPAADAILDRWASCGISAIKTDEDPSSCVRSPAEKAMASDYIDIGYGE